MSCLPKGVSLLKKPLANEITETLAFTVRKVELRGEKISVTVTFLTGDQQQSAKQIESDVQQNKKKLRSNCRSVITRGPLDGHEISN